jgi:Mce-associated membrane protein
VTADETSVEETAKVEESPEVEKPADTDDHGKEPGRLKRFAAQAKKPPSGKIRPTVLALLVLPLLVIASLALVGGLFWFSYRPDRATDASAAKAAMSAASEGTVAVLSYSPDTFDRDFSSAKSHLTGDFLTRYSEFTQQIVAPAAKQKSVRTSAVVLRAGVSEIHPNSAVVLLFVNQSTQSKDRPEPTFASNSVSVTLTKADGKWLISSFSPL